MKKTEIKEIYINRPLYCVGTTEAGRLLGISPARVRVLLKEDRIKGAYKLDNNVWAIPLYENGMPSVRRAGKKGPLPKWKSYQGHAKTVVHAYKNHIGKKDENGQYKPPLAVHNTGTGNYSAYALDIEGPCTFYYQPENPRCNGARLWIETVFKVTPIGPILPPPNSKKKTKADAAGRPIQISSARSKPKSVGFG